MFGTFCFPQLFHLRWLHLLHLPPVVSLLRVTLFLDHTFPFLELKQAGTNPEARSKAYCRPPLGKLLDNFFTLCLSLQLRECCMLLDKEASFFLRNPPFPSMQRRARPPPAGPRRRPPALPGKRLWKYCSENRETARTDQARSNFFYFVRCTRISPTNKES